MRFVLLESIGKARVRTGISREMLERVLAR
jgi:hypothetical protein